MSEQTIIRVKSMMARDLGHPAKGVIVCTDQGDEVICRGWSAYHMLYWHVTTPGIQFVLIARPDGDWEMYEPGWRWPDGGLYLGFPEPLSADVGRLAVYGMESWPDSKGRRRWVVWTNDHSVYYTYARDAERMHEIWAAGRANDCMLDVSRIGRKLVLRWVPAQPQEGGARCSS